MTDKKAKPIKPEEVVIVVSPDMYKEYEQIAKAIEQDNGKRYTEEDVKKILDK